MALIRPCGSRLARIVGLLVLLYGGQAVAAVSPTWSTVDAAGGGTATSLDESMAQLFAEVEAMLAEINARFDAARDPASTAFATAGSTPVAGYQTARSTSAEMAAAAMAAARERHLEKVAAAVRRAAAERDANDRQLAQAQAAAVAEYERTLEAIKTRPVSVFRRVPGGLAGELQRTQSGLSADHADRVAAIARQQQQTVEQATAELAAELARLEQELADEKIEESTDPGPDMPAKLSWTIPASRVGGAPLTMADLAGYELYYATVGSPDAGVIVIASPDQTDYALRGLQPGNYVFAISAIDQDGRKSDLSQTVEVTVH